MAVHSEYVRVVVCIGECWTCPNAVKYVEKDFVADLSHCRLDSYGRLRTNCLEEIETTIFSVPSRYRADRETDLL
jgi:hypothetical protein